MNFCEFDVGTVANGFPVVGVTDTVYRVPLITNTSDVICPGGLQLKWLHGKQSSNQIVFVP